MKEEQAENDLKLLEEIFKRNDIHNTMPVENTLDLYMDELCFKIKDGKIYIVNYL